ncbi:MAG TPA: retropepsin-like aspartic protease, partial [Isosphaeraceae bacterium]|nr:retropepsin-like aspartic protease [Isosphaeraceae bacterium]
MSPTARMLLVLAALAPAALACAEEPRTEIPRELVLERFRVAKGGDLLLVPVRFAGRDRLFVVDTGNTLTTFDESLPLGVPRTVVESITPQGRVPVRIYDSPSAEVGRLPLQVPYVIGADLGWMREISGYRIDGVLGMDFLRRFVVHIDFDRGELLLLKAVPRDAGEAIALR